MTDATVKFTPTQIDDLCLAFDKQRVIAELEQQRLSTAKGNLLAVIQHQGYTPGHAPKTTRLEGLLYIADATVGSTVEIAEGPVGELQSELSRLRKPKLFAELFDRKTTHKLKKDAPSALKAAIGAFAEEVQARLLGIFAQCFSVNSSAPKVSVELSASLREKEAEAQRKAEAKAAKAAKKAGKK
jgi:hypothetical protein